MMGKTLIIGGATCAARLRRLDETAEIIILERGEYISYANCGLPYHVGKVIEERDALLAWMNKNDVYPGVHYVDNTQYRIYAYAAGTCPHAARAGDRLLSLPMHLRLTPEDTDTVVRVIREFMEEGKR